jgi:NAD(P)-dependent dehydrogenase (short-subunit alcohol dehydrogenase family)
VRRLDLADLRSVDEFAAAILQEVRIDYLILNAGVMACPLNYTTDGFEMQIGTNHFGHWALTEALLPKLKKQVGES